MPIRLVIFDVDGVIKESPDPYSFLHRHFGTAQAGDRYLRAFLNGSITYDEFAQLDARIWRGRSVAEVKAILRTNLYVAGAHALAAGLHQRRIPFVLLSSGFDLHVEDIARDLHASAYLCNELLHDGRTLLGAMRVYVPWGGKGPIVRHLLHTRQLSPEMCLTVGDSSADIPTFAEVGHALAIRPGSPAVAAAAHATFPDLTGVLDWIDLRP